MQPGGAFSLRCVEGTMAVSGIQSSRLAVPVRTREARCRLDDCERRLIAVPERKLPATAWFVMLAELKPVRAGMVRKAPGLRDGGVKSCSTLEPVQWSPDDKFFGRRGLAIATSIVEREAWTAAPEGHIRHESRLPRRCRGDAASATIRCCVKQTAPRCRSGSHGVEGARMGSHGDRWGRVEEAWDDVMFRVARGGRPMMPMSAAPWLQHGQPAGEWGSWRCLVTRCSGPDGRGDEAPGGCSLGVGAACPLARSLGRKGRQRRACVKRTIILDQHHGDPSPVMTHALPP